MNTKVHAKKRGRKPKDDEATNVVAAEPPPSAPAPSIQAEPHGGVGREIAKRLRVLLMRSAFSARHLSKSAGLSDAHLSLLIRRLDQKPDADVEVGTLIAIAEAAKVSVAWLVTGRDDALGQRLCDLGAQWDEMAEEIEESYPAIPRWSIDAVGRFVLPALPEVPDVVFVAALARAWSDANPEKYREQRARRHEE